MTYRAPGAKGANAAHPALEKPSVVFSLDQMLSFRDTWPGPLSNFNYAVLMEAKNQAAVRAAEKAAEKAAAVVPLQTSENGFRIIDKTKLAEDEKLVREAQRSLNQLAEENFEAVVPPLLQPALFHPDVATQVVERIFEKCIDEPKFAPLYARMCLKLSTYEHEFMKGHSFRKCLVEKVQALFEEEPVRLEHAFTEEELSAARKRKMANTQMVGQLLLTGVLSRKVCAAILDNIFVTQQHPRELDVEVGAHLIEIVCCATPADIAFASNKAAEERNPFRHDRLLPQVIARVEVLKDDERFCKRVQFKLMEILDHSRRNWIPRVGTQPKSAAARAAAKNVEDGPMTPATSDCVVGSTTTPGGGQFPASPASPSGSSCPARRPEMKSSTKQQFINALRTAIPSDLSAFNSTLTGISVLLQSNTVPVNRMAGISVFADSVAKSSDPEVHADAAATLGHSSIETGEILQGFQWSIIEAVRDCIREDCPRFYDRLATLFAQSALLSKHGKGNAVDIPFVAVVRDLFMPTVERLQEQIKKDPEELDDEMCAEELLHAWESFIKTCTSMVFQQGGAGGKGAPKKPKLSELAEHFARTAWVGAMAEIALPDVMGAFLSSGFCTAEEMRAWVDSADGGKGNPRLAAIVDACNLLC